jgi:hypothetical protein
LHEGGAIIVAGLSCFSAGSCFFASHFSSLVVVGSTDFLQHFFIIRSRKAVMEIARQKNIMKNPLAKSGLIK